MTSLNKIELINKYINNIYELSSSFSLYEEYVNLQNKVDLLMNQNIKLTKELNDKNKELQTKNEELCNLTKVSYIQSISKQLTEKDTHISQLENQINKLRKMVEQVKPLEEFKESVDEAKPLEEVKESVEEVKPLEEQVNVQGSIEFDPDNFDEIEGYELIMYKKNYYLKNINKLTVYTIIDNNIGDKVGIINSSGKVKLNKN